MSSSSPVSGDVVKDDPKRPYKTYAAALIAIAITVVQAIQAQSADGAWTTEDTLVTILAFLGAAAVYVTENPKVVRNNTANGLL